jgi:hypothetical protein
MLWVARILIRTTIKTYCMVNSNRWSHSGRNYTGRSLFLIEAFGDTVELLF